MCYALWMATTVDRMVILASLKGRPLEERRQQTTFRLRRASFRGQGLHPDVQEGSWECIRTLIYEGRGA